MKKLSALGITRRYLTELFEKRFDISPEQYIAQIRFQRAKELLDTGRRFTDAAFSIRMESSASFATFFKKTGGDLSDRIRFAANIGTSILLL